MAALMQNILLSLDKDCVWSKKIFLIVNFSTQFLSHSVPRPETPVTRTILLLQNTSINIILVLLKHRGRTITILRNGNCCERSFQEALGTFCLGGGGG